MVKNCKNYNKYTKNFNNRTENGNDIHVIVQYIQK